MENIQIDSEVSDTQQAGKKATDIPWAMRMAAIAQFNIPSKIRKDQSEETHKWCSPELKEKVDAQPWVENPFGSIAELLTKLELVNLRKGEAWRLVPAEVGEINGVPNSRGMLVATNGILCIIYRSDKSLFIGHKEWWMDDEVVYGEKRATNHGGSSKRGAEKRATKATSKFSAEEIEDLLN